MYVKLESLRMDMTTHNARIGFFRIASKRNGSLLQDDPDTRAADTREMAFKVEAERPLALVF
jgi:hypothetical protein